MTKKAAAKDAPPSYFEVTLAKAWASEDGRFSFPAGVHKIIDDAVALIPDDLVLDKQPVAEG